METGPDEYRQQIEDWKETVCEMAFGDSRPSDQKNRHLKCNGIHSLIPPDRNGTARASDILHELAICLRNDMKKRISATVCELPNEPEPFEAVWRDLVSHVVEHRSDVVVLPEMPFAPWLAASENFDPAAWDKAVALHDKWLRRLSEFGEATVASSRPVTTDGKRINEAFVWHARRGYQKAHDKYYLPDEPDFWETTWYQRGGKRFDAVETEHGMMGFMVCTELWFTEHARAYGRQGVQMLICPRSTEAPTTEKWIMGGRAAAVTSGSFCLSSNRSGVDHSGHPWGGHGWIIEPDQGAVLGTTSVKRPFLTLELDLLEADQAKSRYPRYVAE